MNWDNIMIGILLLIGIGMITSILFWGVGVEITVQEKKARGECWDREVCECTEKCESLGKEFFHYDDATSGGYYDSGKEQKCWCVKDNETTQIY